MITARLVTLTSLATSLHNVYVKPVVSHFSARPGLYVTHLLCLTCSWLKTTYSWASNLGLLPLQLDVVFLTLQTMGNIYMWPRLFFLIALNYRTMYVSVLFLQSFTEFCGSYQVQCWGCISIDSSFRSSCQNPLDWTTPNCVGSSAFCSYFRACG